MANVAGFRVSARLGTATWGELGWAGFAIVAVVAVAVAYVGPSSLGITAHQWVWCRLQRAQRPPRRWSVAIRPPPGTRSAPAGGVHPQPLGLRREARLRRRATLTRNGTSHPLDGDRGGVTPIRGVVRLRQSAHLFQSTVGWRALSSLGFVTAGPPSLQSIEIKALHVQVVAPGGAV